MTSADAAWRSTARPGRRPFPMRRFPRTTEFGFLTRPSLIAAPWMPEVEEVIVAVVKRMTAR
jgi:hypothetical protein